ncbi:MFS general substrate transporter [Aaosphaeria arxii CBS 175.79]|uniref:MFS general substrate transporter n=1 Tax=Aaosphaeria arxii CBS 175.79 TaxID=1450172 RepID=A0A6A5YAJ7_9PLEO|nr:MFS general substrate transporter [Aaosphaeria arxii CBS 175.79]KAF2021614.1 MFS general substrate transporter [Aaosphaeria arxii CBS 175.79]
MRASLDAQEHESLLIKLIYQARSEKSLTDGTEKIDQHVTWRNLPNKKQLLILSLCRLSSPLSNACLLPYLYFLVKSLLSDPEHPSAPQTISQRTGFLVAAYPLGQVLTSILWGRLSDIYGRKPIILIGITLSVLANLSFGFSRGIGMLLFWRVVAGMANGILGVMRTMTAEIVKHRKYQPRAFLAPPVVFNSGRVVALAIGGCLADPVKNIPTLFGPKGLLNLSKSPDGVIWAIKYPYALPAMFNGVVLALCLLVAIFWLEESLQYQERHRDTSVVFGQRPFGHWRRRVDHRENRGYLALPIEDTESTPQSDPTNIGASSDIARTGPAQQDAPPLLKNIWTWHLLKTLVAFGLLPLHNSTFLHLFPVFLAMPSVTTILPTVFEFSGGLGLSSPTIGLFLATFGIFGIVLQLFIYPRIQKHVGNLGIFRIASGIFPVAYLLAPYLALLSEVSSLKWPAMAVILFLQVLARTMAIPSSVILLTRTSPTKGVLGTVHGAGNTVSSLASAIGPAIGGVILSRGIRRGSVGLVWWSWMCVVSSVTLAWAFVLDRTESEDEEKRATGVREVELR